MVRKTPAIFYPILGGFSMIRIIICDDDLEMLERIKKITEAILSAAKTKAVVHTYTDPLQISNQILQSCDLALLDVDLDLDRCNGMDLARKLRELRRDAVILFITNFIEYAPEGYEVQAFRYILKHDLESSLNTYLPQALQRLDSEKEMFKIKMDGEIIDLPINQILYMEVQQHYTTLFVQQNPSRSDVKAYEVHTSLSNLEKQLESHGFLRIHKSYLVNMKYIQKFQIRGVQLYNGTVLRVSETNYAENKQKFLFWKGCIPF